eukprot:gene4667-3346_t
MGQVFTKSHENAALETFEFASDLSLAAIDNFRRKLGVSRYADPPTISAAFRHHKVAITFTSSNSLQQAIGLKLHKHSDLEDLLSSVCTGHIPNDLVPFALTRLAFQRSPQNFRGNADIQSVIQFFLDSERVFPTLEHANALITQALSQLTKAISPPQQQRVFPTCDPFLRTMVPSLLENACCSTARRWLQTRPGEQSPYFSRYFAMVQSSGVGKSRALEELRRNGERVFVVCVTLRQRENVGEPPRTPVVADFLETNVTTFYDWDIFLHAVTHQLNRRFTAAGAIPSTGRPRDDFHVDLLAVNSQFWTDVVAMFRTVQALLVPGQNKENSSWAAIRHDVFVQQATAAGVVNHLHRSQTVLVVALDECVDALVRKRGVENVNLPPVPAVAWNNGDLAWVERVKAAAFSCASLRWDVTTHSPTLMRLLVRERLALIRKVAPRMTRVWCQYSFEPALARHVAEQMRRDENAFEAALTALSEVHEGGYLEMKEGRGNNAGEMAATIVLCRAMDKAQPAHATKIAPVWLHSWLAQLFPAMAAGNKTHWRQIFRQSAARRGVVYFHSARRIEEPLTRDVLLRYLRCGTAIIAPRDEPVTALYVPVAYPKPQQWQQQCDANDVAVDIAVDLADPRSFTLGVVTVHVKNVATTDDSTPLQEEEDNRFTHTTQLLDNGDVVIPRVGLELQMHPALQRPDTISTPVVAPGHANGLRLEKYFANGFPCLPTSSPAYRTVRSLFECPPIDAHVLAMLRESQVKGDDVLGRGADSELCRMATMIGEKMFHARHPANVDEAATAATVMARGGAPSGPPPPITGRRKRQSGHVEEEGKEKDVDDPVEGGSNRTRRQSQAY